jgi:hypothetical protein
MRPYAVFLHADVFNNLPTQGSSRRPILAFLEQLGPDPFQTGDYQETDAAGRPSEVKVIGKYAVAYWADHAVREVKVLRLELAD